MPDSGKSTQPEVSFQHFFQFSLDMMVVAGANGFFRRVNPVFCNLVGRSEEEIIAEPFWNLVHPEDRGKVEDALKVLATGHPAFLVRVRIRLADGSYRPLEWTAYPDRDTGLLYAIARDAPSNNFDPEQLKLLMDFSPTAVLLVNQDGTIQHANRLAETTFAASRNEMTGLQVEKIIPVRFRIKHEEHRNEYFAAPRLRPMGTVTNLVGLRRDGVEFPIDIGLNPTWFNGRLVVVCSVIDISSQNQVVESLLQERQRLERDKLRLKRLAERDTLTGLYNRRAFERILLEELTTARDKLKAISIISLDIDEFKMYNDDFGHPAGDVVLKEIADILTFNVRKGDIVARFGGEEFIICLPGTVKEDSMRLGERLRAVIEKHKGFERTVTVSVGATTFTFTQKRTAVKRVRHRMIEEADKALYHSKNQGRNVFHHFLNIDTTESK